MLPIGEDALVIIPHVQPLRPSRLDIVQPLPPCDGLEMLPTRIHLQHKGRHHTRCESWARSRQLTPAMHTHKLYSSDKARRAAAVAVKSSDKLRRAVAS